MSNTKEEGAIGGMKPITMQPTSPPPSISPEVIQMMDTFSKMGVKPKADTPEQLMKWMSDFMQAQKTMKEGSDTKFAFPPPPKTDVPPQKEDKAIATKLILNQPPKITWFSGTDLKSGDATYEIWRHEVNCMRKQNYDKDAMLIAVRRSLRGEAGMVAMRIDLDANIDDIIRKLDSIYGSVDRKEILLTQFYGARQEKDEDISHWSCRLERIIGKCVDGGLVHHSEVDQQLHFMLWNGLKASLKAISGYKYDTIKDFDGLRVALRQIENYVPQESTSTSKPHISKAVTGQSEFDEIKGMIQQLGTRMDSFESKRPEQQSYRPTHQPHQSWKPTQPQQSWKSTQPQQRWMEPETQSWTPQQEPWTQQETQSWRPQSQQQSRKQTQQSWKTRQESQWQQRGRGKGNYNNQQLNDTFGENIQCWRCGLFGHVQTGCRIRVDHLRKDLNGKKPMQRERP